MNIVGVLLAAGRGQRFDASGERNKLLAPLADGHPVVEASARALLGALPQVVAVVRDGDDELAALLRELGCAVTPCPDAERGMAASLAHGLRHSPAHADAWIIALADMPFVQTATISALCAGAIRWPLAKSICRRCWPCRATPERATFSMPSA